VGANRPLTVRTRIVAATNRRLTDEIKAGRFREDLYYRLGVIPVRLPPLRERGADTKLLADRMVDDLSGGRCTLSPEAHARLAGYGWPGNVRELKNVLMRAIFLSGSDVLCAADITWSSPESGDGVPAVATKTLAEIEREHIMEALEKAGGHKDTAAKALGIGLTTLKEKLRAWKQGRPE
jgi:two-component system response regulator AtoC